MESLVTTIGKSRYENYMYSYPHKKAYREFDEPIDLETLWGKSELKELTLYIHIPFCTNKCGYCNLLSITGFQKAQMSQYVEQLLNEMVAVRQFLGSYSRESTPFSSVILGGGTPTILADQDLKKILEGISTILAVDFEKIFFSTETSPRTITQSKLNLIREYQINRVSMGVQSFNETELKAIYRRESVPEIEKALELLFKEPIPIRNLDLIYGIPSQTLKTWGQSLARVVEYNPEEIYLYPLYVRAGTGLYRKVQRDIELMGEMYEQGRLFLVEHGYLQTSMRNFIRKDMAQTLFPKYSCQQLDMVGIGCGARSYRDNIHYSQKYAVGETSIQRIVEGYLAEDDFSVARYGYFLNEDEIKRRYVIKSILKVTGLDVAEYVATFQSLPLADFKELEILVSKGFLMEQDRRIYLTPKGMRWSDAIGNLFISREVQGKIDDFFET